MKACGISLYRIALPMVACAIAAGALLFALEESVLGPANRRAEALNNTIRGRRNGSEAINRQWVVGPGARSITTISSTRRPGRCSDCRSTSSTTAWSGSRGARSLSARPRLAAAGTAWRLEDGWTRAFSEAGAAESFSAFPTLDRTLDSLPAFVTEAPDARFMGYAQLKTYTERLRASGFDVLEQDVALAGKLAFPFVTIIMTLMAVPFAVLTGRGGAMAAIGIGIGLALTYWITISVFAAMGTGGLVAPLVAAWAPNMLFGSAAVYLLLTVRT